ncbi:PTS ascorbate transporter subunit IIC [Spiractinospora alimapuensis]|uniref:PTS ascorbate transporter subunit IIC n=1 Tax=Spiractinospora alimapuensis TaxID=2820884 RepID=UPI001F3CFED3|nr:PTS ascorbate transporter subunit IIC [Spiractinospora alimapuensis]QVQ53835.1 PTS ascorbate transporter subunit IIC [Spiractinospora alimapuensis]
MEALHFFVALIQVPAIIVGLIALVGLVVQRKPLGDTVAGTIKTVLSMLIIAGGITVLTTALGPIQLMFENSLPTGGIQTFVTFDEGVVSAVQTENVANIGMLIGLTLLFGYAFHLFLARVTKARFVYLTGHMIWVHAGAFAILFHSLGFGPVATVVLASLLDGAYMTFAPAIAQPFMRKITGRDDIAFGHGQTLLNVLGALVGRAIGNPKKSTEDIKVPEKLNFFRDIAVSTSIVMTIVAFAAAIAALIQLGTTGFAEEISDGENWAVFTLLAALGFTAGMLILLYGVRMLIAEIVPAFEGIARKLIPNAKPALDVPVIFAFAPNALIIGLIAGVLGQLAGMALLAGIGWPVPIPSMIAAFFACGAAAIFGNATGGRVGAWAGGFLWGFLGWILISYAYKFEIFGDLTAMGALGLGFTVPDAIVPAIVLDGVARIFGAGGGIAAAALTVAAVAAATVTAIVWKPKSTETAETAEPAVESAESDAGASTEESAEKSISKDD